MADYPIEYQGLVTDSSHTPFELHVSPQALAGGFCRQLNAALSSHPSTRLWAALEHLRPAIAA